MFTCGSSTALFIHTGFTHTHTLLVIRRTEYRPTIDKANSLVSHSAPSKPPLHTHQPEWPTSGPGSAPFPWWTSSVGVHRYISLMLGDQGLASSSNLPPQRSESLPQSLLERALTDPPTKSHLRLIITPLWLTWQICYIFWIFIQKKKSESAQIGNGRSGFLKIRCWPVMMTNFAGLRIVRVIIAIINGNICVLTPFMSNKLKTA